MRYEPPSSLSGIFTLGKKEPVLEANLYGCYMLYVGMHACLYVFIKPCKKQRSTVSARSKDLLCLLSSALENDFYDILIS